MSTFENHKKSTGELLEFIRNSTENLDTLMEQLHDEQLDISLADYFNKIMKEKDLTPSQIAKASNLQVNYALQIISGTKPHPSRNKLLALGFAMKLNLEETQQMLRIANHPILYPRHRQDLAIIFALKKQYSLRDVNEILEDLGEELLQ